jgi:glycosyltransferase involved in cell wall biosynthesis
MPLISIIIPVFNRANFVMNTICTIFKQRFRDYELIIVDDGSTDDLERVLSSEISTKQLIYVFQENQGVSSARNMGTFLAKGKYLVFLDSDDLVTENWLFDYENAIKTSDPDIIYCGINRFSDNILVEYTDPTNPYKDGKSFGNVIPGSFCIKKTFFEIIGRYDEQLAYGENTELGFRIKMTSPTTAFIRSPNLIYNLHENSHGKNVRNKMNGIIYTINKHPLIFNENKDMKRRFLSIAGVAAVSIKENIRARELFWKAWKLSPLNFIMLLRLLFSLSPFIIKKIWVNK